METNGNGVRYISHPRFPESLLPLFTQNGIQSFAASRTRHTKHTTEVKLSSLGYSSLEMATSSFNRSKIAASFIAERKLQPPMWEWTPFLLGLPIEVLELIFSNFEFQLPGEAHTENDSLHTTELLRKRISLKDPHPFNTLAATSRSMRDGIEDCCEHLLEMYRKNTCNKCPSTDEKSASLNLDAFNELAGAGKADEDEAPSQAVRYVMLNNCFVIR